MNIIESGAVTYSNSNTVTLARPHLIPIAVSLLLLIVFLLHGPIGQLDHYHDFADQRSLGGIPHAMDVWSNVGFAIVGTLGLAVCWMGRRQLGARTAGYTIFFAAMLMTAFGSSWYHIAPDNSRLVWDRLPIAVACAGIMSAAWAEFVNSKQARFALPWLLLGACLSVAWWHVTELTGMGDLRPYLWLQALPLITVPLLLWKSPKRPARAGAWTIAILCYVLAKGFELADHAIFDLLHLISGHTFKHLFATLAAWAIYWRLQQLVSTDTSYEPVTQHKLSMISKAH